MDREAQARRGVVHAVAQSPLAAQPQLVEVVPSAVVTDNCTPAVDWQIESIRMNEGDTETTYDPVHDQWLEEGFTSDDIQVVGGRILLRAERKGSSLGGSPCGPGTTRATWPGPRSPRPASPS